jgi:hypothetical protein
LTFLDSLSLFNLKSSDYLLALCVSFWGLGCEFDVEKVNFGAVMN